MSGSKKLLTVLLCLVLLIAFILCTIPVPKRINTTFYGYAVNSNGDVIDTFTLTSRGKIRNYLFVTDEIMADFTLAFDSGSTLRAKSTGPFMQLDDQTIVCNFNYLSGESQTLDGGYMAVTPDGANLILDGMTSGVYYVATTDSSMDADSLLSIFNDFTQHK